MKHNFLILSFLFAFFTAGAQDSKWTIGLEAGPNWSDIPNWYGSGFFLPGISAGLTGEYAVTNKISIKSGLLFQQKGHYTYQNATDSIGMPISGNYFESTYRLNYLVLPVYGKLYLGNKTKFFVELGPYFGYLLDASFKMVYHRNSQPDQVNTESQTTKFNRADVGASLGAGISIPVKSRFAIDLGLRYDQGILNINPNTTPGPGDLQPPVLRNISINFLAGIKYKLNN
jgi:opacity protein-like surface antigen